MGLRLRDAVSLAWENVNFELRQIRYFPRKRIGPGPPARLEEACYRTTGSAVNARS